MASDGNAGQANDVEDVEDTAEEPKVNTNGDMNGDKEMKQELPQKRKRGADSISSEVPDVMQMPGFMHEDQTVKLNVDNEDEESMEVSAKARSKRPITSPEKLAAVRKEAAMSFGFDEDGEEMAAAASKVHSKGSVSPRVTDVPEKSSPAVAEAPKRRGRPPKIRNDSESSQKAVMKPNKEANRKSLKAGNKTPIRDETTEEEPEEEEERTTSGRRRAKPPQRYGDESPKPTRVKEEKNVKGRTKSVDAEDADSTPKAVEVTTPVSGKTPGSAKRGRPRKDPGATPKSPKPRGRPRKDVASTEEEDEQEEDEKPIPKSLHKPTPKQSAALELKEEIPKKKGRGRPRKVLDNEEPMVSPQKTRGRPKKVIQQEEEEEEEEELEEEEEEEEEELDEDEELYEVGEILDDDDDEDDDEEYSPGRKPRGKVKQKGTPGRKRPRSQSDVRPLLLCYYVLLKENIFFMEGRQHRIHPKIAFLGLFKVESYCKNRIFIGI